MRHFDCIIIGAGATGLMCGATAGKRGKTVAILDHSDKVGTKILMSGGGRCNFTTILSQAIICRPILTFASPRYAVIHNTIF